MPQDSIPWDEFKKRMEGFDVQEKRIIEERIRTNYRRDHYEFLTDDEAQTLGAMLDRLIPQDGEEKLDLVGFMDWAIPNPLGYGDRQEDMPDEEAIFREGLQGIDDTAKGLFGGRKFAEISASDKDHVLRLVQEGKAEGSVWEHIPSDTFLRKLMMKAVAGYCAHPKIWVRIGFYGPAYPEGYVWTSVSEVIARHEKKPGYLDF